MIPYYVPPSIPIGPLTIEPFGILTAIGVAVGAWLAARAARLRGLDPTLLHDFAPWGLVGGLVVGHLMHLFLYHPEELTGPLAVLKVWDGQSSTGGLLGGILAAVIFFRRRGIALSTYTDALALGIVPGWAIARLGCFAVHDHPGVRTDFFLAVAFPGGARHDLGLYDALLLGALTLVLYVLAHRRVLEGRLLAVASLGYGVGRFGLDFLRATDLAYVDARYLGLTPAQYVCLGLVAYGVWRLVAGGDRRVPDGHSSPPGRHAAATP